jgi:glycosyltransferase involved in cell wall biosynthesis
MIKVLFDHQTFSLQRYGGISRYFANLYHSISDNKEIKIEIGSLASRNNYISDYPFFLKQGIANTFFKKDRKLYKLNKKYSNHLVKKSDFDIFHPTYYDPYFLNNIDKPFVVTVYDMIHELMPEFFDSNNIDAENKKKLIDRADKIIAISESTKKDIIDVYNIDSNKIKVIHLGYFDDEIDLALTQENFDLKPYLLYVGDRNTYKNFYNFLKAISPIFKKRKDLQLICAGGGPFKSSEIQAINRAGINNRIFQKNVSGFELKSLYANAELFIFPSLYEGFGFPLIEAFANNCAVACSNTSSFIEVAGDAAVLFNPLIIDEITFAIDKILDDSSIKTKIIAEGRNQKNKFTNEKCASLTKDVYYNLL